MLPYAIKCYICVSDDDSTITIMDVHVPVVKRAKPSEYVYTPEELIGFNDLLSRLNISIDEVNAIKAQIEEAEQKANAATQKAEGVITSLEGMTATATGLDEGTSPTVLMETKEDGTKNLAFGIPSGKSGRDGVSPTIVVTEITGGHRVTITDVNGETSFIVLNGTTSSGGSGTGADGFSPIVEVTEISGGHRVTITDVDGSKSFDVLDGENGQTPRISAVAVTGDPGTEARVEQSGTDDAPVFTFTIPRGDTPPLSDAAPSSLGEANAGVSNNASREDHIHPLPVIDFVVDENGNGSITIKGASV